MPSSDLQLNADITVAEALLQHTILLGKTRDPRIKVSAGKAEIEAKEKLEALRAQASSQSELSLATTGAAS